VLLHLGLLFIQIGQFRFQLLLQSTRGVRRLGFPPGQGEEQDCSENETAEPAPLRSAARLRCTPMLRAHHSCLLQRKMPFSSIALKRAAAEVIIVLIPPRGQHLLKPARSAKTHTGEGRGKKFMQISMEMRALVPSDVLIQELQGESVLLNVGTGRYFGLDDMGTRMWAVLTTSESLQGAFDTLLAEFDVDGQRLEADLRNLVEKLVECRLVEIR
jgi:hypothetical protein